MKRCVPLLFFVFFSCAPPAFSDPCTTPAPEKYSDALRAAYQDAGMELFTSGNDVFARIGGEGIPLLPGQGCPPASPDAPEDPPLCALFSSVYPLGAEGRYPAPGFSPGRVRNQAFLQQLYGKDQKEVEENCTMVNFLGESVPFNQKHGAADALRRVAARLESALEAQPGLADYIFPTAGTFYWRTIKNSPRLSAHSFAIAIDLNTTKGIYWLWDYTPELLEQTRHNYPQPLVDAFEAEGFIWGGKWDAFDFMHFEYRPEMILYHGGNTE